ncbi:MAG TPA: efflux RND transporter periplasmic adaptor subunit, partial [Vicinamibacterales bacterium]|nr:efflux RND transporter periplasmic adaptor subunit [Vicinamibacterales bacterium]
MRFAGRTLGLLLLLALATGGAYYGWRTVAARKAARQTAPRLVRPEHRTVDATVVATGSIKLRVGAEVRVGSQVSGIVRTLNVTVGSHIRKGDLIARIDSRVLKAQEAQAQAQVAIARVTLDKAQLDYRRNRQLAAQQIIPRQTLDDSRLAVDSARATLDKARRDLDAVRVNLTYVAIHAPISGTVASVSTQEGETVAASFTAPTFVTIIADHALQLVAMVDETDIGHVTAGDRVTFTTEAYPSTDLTGIVERIAPTATIVSDVVNYPVTIAIDGPQTRLRPDMTANVIIRTARRKALVVPDAAIHRDGEERFIYVDRAGRLQRQPIVTGERLSGFTEVKRGLG